MDILFVILAIYGLVMIAGLIGAGVKGTIAGKGQGSHRMESPKSVPVEALHSTGEQKRYEKWLQEHRDGVILPTAEERHAEYMRELAKAAADREEERRYESWLFQHYEDFKTPKERFEAWVNR